MSDPWVDDTFQQLLSILPGEGPRALSLDQVASAVGAAPVTPAQIEALFAELERAGVAVGEDEDRDLAGLLRTVLDAARDLRALGKTADKAQVAAHSGLTEGAVHVALLYADVLRQR